MLLNEETFMLVIIFVNYLNIILKEIYQIYFYIFFHFKILINEKLENNFREKFI